MPYWSNRADIRLTDIRLTDIRISDKLGDDQFGDDEFRGGVFDHCVTTPSWNIKVGNGGVDLDIGILLSIFLEMSRPPQLLHKVGRRE